MFRRFGIVEEYDIKFSATSAAICQSAYCYVPKYLNL
jgi:hypothetical protein